LHLATFAAIPVFFFLQVDATRAGAFCILLVSRAATELVVRFADRRTIRMAVAVFTFTFFVSPKAKVASNKSEEYKV
jgi:hypothetical protein